MLTFKFTYLIVSRMDPGILTGRAPCKCILCAHRSIGVSWVYHTQESARQCLAICKHLNAQHLKQYNIKLINLPSSAAKVSVLPLYTSHWIIGPSAWKANKAAATPSILHVIFAQFERIYLFLLSSQAMALYKKHVYCHVHWFEVWNILPA